MIERDLIFLNPETIYFIKHSNGRERLKNVNTNIYSYLETSGGQSSNLYLKVVHFFNTAVN